MGVRRLAEDSQQPAKFAFNRAFAAEAKVWIKKYPKGRQQSAVIPLLMLAQDQDGWVTKTAIEHIADMLEMPYIRALEVATFYTQFQLAPIGTKAHVQVCGTTPCMLRGSEDLIKICKSKIHSQPAHRNESGTLSWEEVECQGTCVNAPMVMIGKDTYEDLTPERLAYIIDRFEAGRPEEIAAGPQIARVFSAPEGGQTTLTTEILVGTASKKAPKKAAAKAPAQKPTKAAKPKQQTLLSTKTVKAPDEVKPVKAKIAAVGKPKTVAKPTTKQADKTEATVDLADKNRPAQVAKPKVPDDLKLISGVGPKLEGVLHGLGIYTFAQVASWKKAEREWVDGYLKFKGRIDRDDWIKQAKALAKGGAEEYIRVFGKKPR